MIILFHVAPTRLERVYFSSPILRETFSRPCAWSGSCEKALRRAFFMRCGAVYACSVTGRYQGRVCKRAQPFDLPFYHSPTPLPTLRMPSVSSHTKHIFPACSPQVSTASLSARRQLAVDVSQGTLQRHPSAPSRADSVRTFIYTALHRRLIPSKVSSDSSSCSTLVDNVVRAIPL
jgi:hypothetical protein